METFSQSFKGWLDYFFAPQFEAKEFLNLFSYRSQVLVAGKLSLMVRQYRVIGLRVPGVKEKNLVIEYKVGDTVIHCAHGMGEIIKMDEKFIHERKMLCYVVRTQDLTIWVNADESGTTSSIRPPTPETEFENLFAILCSPGEPLPSGWYDRKNYLFERMKEGDLTSICYVIRDLTMHRRVKKFNDSDKNILDRAQSLLITEWMYSRSVSWTQARDELTRLLE